MAVEQEKWITQEYPGGPPKADALPCGGRQALRKDGEGVWPQRCREEGRPCGGVPGSMGWSHGGLLQWLALGWNCNSSKITFRKSCNSSRPDSASCEDPFIQQMDIDLPPCAHAAVWGTMQTRCFGGSRVYCAQHLGYPEPITLSCYDYWSLRSSGSSPKLDVSRLLVGRWLHSRTRRLARPGHLWAAKLAVAPCASPGFLGMRMAGVLITSD